MADVTNPVAPGNQTSEGRLTKVLTGVGLVFGILAPIVTELTNAFPDQKWLGAVAMVVGWGTALLAQLGYSKHRAGVKQAMIMTDSAPMGGALLATQKQLEKVEHAENPR